MHELECLRVFVLKDDPCLARMFHLTEKRAELDASFMIYESLREKTTTVATLENPRAQVDVLTVTHGRKAFQGFVDASFDAQVETTRVELVHFFLSTTNATCGEKRGHRVVDGLLYGRERRMRPVGTAEGIARLTVEFGLYGLQVVFRHDDIGVQDDEVVALAALGAVVARRARTGVGFEVVAQSELTLVFFTNVIAFLSRAVFHDNHFKVFNCLVTKALQQLVDFLWPVVDGYDD